MAVSKVVKEQKNERTNTEVRSGQNSKRKAILTGKKNQDRAIIKEKDVVVNGNAVTQESDRLCPHQLGTINIQKKGMKKKKEDTDHDVKLGQQNVKVQEKREIATKHGQKKKKKVTQSYKLSRRKTNSFTSHFDSRVIRHVRCVRKSDSHKAATPKPGKGKKTDWQASASRPFLTFYFFQQHLLCAQLPGFGIILTGTKDTVPS